MLTEESVGNLIESSRPRQGAIHGPLLALFGLALLLGALLATPDLVGGGIFSVILSQMILLGLIGFTIRQVIKRKRISRLMLESFEAVQLHQWERARAVLLELLKHPLRHPQARAESLLALAAVAEADHAYEASQQVYESLLTESQADPLQLHTAQVALAAAMLRTGQVTDAVNLIDRLTRQELPDALKAQIELLSLFREVVMGHAAEGINRADERRKLFRDNLSTRAGYGYGLLALAFDQANQPEKAGQYWRDATLLVRPDELVERFDVLSAMAAKYPAKEFLL